MLRQLFSKTVSIVWAIAMELPQCLFSSIRKHLMWLALSRHTVSFTVICASAESLYMVFAQTAIADPISGGAGWLGAGLLGLVLGWLLLMHLPNKDKQIDKVITLMADSIKEKDIRMNETIKDKDARLEMKDKQLSEQLDKKWTMIQSMTQEHRKEMQMVTEHCNEELTNITNSFQKETEKIVSAIKEAKK